MEGKEIRFGIANSALWATATTAASNGSVNSMHDSFTPLGGLMPMWLMQLGEVIFGGVGSGLYGMLAFVIIAVFVAGLDGRTHAGIPGQENRSLRDEDGLTDGLDPGHCWSMLAQPSRWCLLQAGRPSITLAAWLQRNSVCLFIGRQQQWQRLCRSGREHPVLQYRPWVGHAVWTVLAGDPGLAIAGSLVQKKKVRSAPERLPTHTPLFIVWLIGVIIIVGALSFFPALALGPIVEHLMMVDRL